MAERLFHRKIYQKNKKKRRILWVLKFFVFSFFLLILGVLAVFIYYAKDLPRPEKFTERTLRQSTKIYDRSGQILLYEIYGEEKRTWIPLNQIPDFLKKAVISSEDANFYHHFGVDFKGILRSVLINLRIKKAVYGGSTIPQQLIRSTFFSTEKTVQRKIKEIILALELDRRYSKDQILEWYLNQVPFGQNSYGVQAASQTYFQKSVSEISLSEAALLTVLIKAPSYLSPYGTHKDELLAKKDYVLDQMEALGYIPAEQAKAAKEAQINFAKISQPINAPHFTFWIRDYLETKYGQDFLREKGLKVYTTLDWEFQELAEKAVKEGAEKNRQYHAFNMALVAIDPKNGEVLAMVGSKNWFGAPYPEGCIPGSDCLFDPYPNVALMGRQPGSAFKPFAYVTAFEKDYNDKTTVLDAETNFGIWGGKPYTPQNYDGRFRGTVTLREALAQSLNVPSVKVLLDLAGLADTLETAKTLGITTLNKPLSFYGPSIVLGGGEVKLLDMASAYGAFATEGFRLPPVNILKIEDSEGNIIEQNKKTLQRVLDKGPANLINSILSDNEARSPIFGFHSSMFIENYQTAAKTGTTQDYRDGWIIGYTPSIVVGVWAGNSNNEPMWGKPGAVIVGPTWKAFMLKVLPKYPKETFNLDNLTDNLPEEKTILPPPEIPADELE